MLGLNKRSCRQIFQTYSVLPLLFSLADLCGCKGRGQSDLFDVGRRRPSTQMQTNIEIFKTEKDTWVNFPQPDYLIQAEVCRRELGGIPDVDCSASTGIEVNPLINNEYDCRNPSIVSKCSPMKLFHYITRPGVHWIAACRHDSTGLIGWDSRTGKTCFFNTPIGRDNDARFTNRKLTKKTDFSMMAIDRSIPFDPAIYPELIDKYYAPHSFPEEEECTSCHQGNDPWIVSDYIKSEWDKLKIPRVLSIGKPDGYNYQILGLGRFGFSHGAALIDPFKNQGKETADDCTSCHILAFDPKGAGNGRKSILAQSIGIGNGTDLGPLFPP